MNLLLIIATTVGVVWCIVVRFSSRNKQRIVWEVDQQFRYYAAVDSVDDMNALCISNGQPYQLMQAHF